MSPEQRARLRADLGFDRSIVSQFLDYLGDLSRFDFGTSTYYRNESTMDVITDFLPKTLQLVAAGMLVAFVVSICLGTLAAVRICCDELGPMPWM